MLEKIKEYLLNNPNVVKRLKSWARKVYRYGFVLFISFLAASVTSALIMNIMTGIVSKNIRPLAASGAKAAGLAMLKRPNINYHDIKKNIMDRNIFNSEGKFPDEKVTAGENNESTRNRFDINGPCKDTSLNISLVGTIFNGNRFHSFAVVREKGYSQSDVYGVGDEIIGEEQASIAAVEQQSVILNNAGVKECMQLEQPVAGKESMTGGNAPAATQSAESGSTTKATNGTVEVSLGEVEKASGEGGEGLLNSGRIVPVNDPETSQMLGFKLISVKADGLFSKIGLSNGDVITQVNDTSLKEPDKGFQFYQVFEDETDIKISFLRNGKQPSTISVTIK